MVRYVGVVPLALGVAFLIAIGGALAEDKCRTGCRGVKQQLFKYQVGSTYKYNLESSIDIFLSSAENQQSSTKVRGTVLLTQQANCNQILRLQDVQVIGPDSKKHGNLADIKKAIQLNFHDGHLEDEICIEAGDSQNSINLKRAVASLFQANVKHNHETDVFGSCPTDVTSRKDGAVTVIQKSRNLNRCSHRESVKNDFIATSFNLNSEIKSSPLLSAEYESEQRIKNGYVDHAVVTENYLYKPFSVGKNGVKAVVTTKINFVGISQDNIRPKTVEPRSIIFDNPHPVNTPSTNIDGILNALKETGKTMDVSVDEKAAKSFSQLVKVLRVSSKNDILAVYGQVKAGAGFRNKEAAKKVFFDALVRAGTGDAIEVGIKLLESNELSPIEQKLIYLSLSFVKHATPDSINAAVGLLDLPNLPRQAYLGVGTLANRYYTEHKYDSGEGLSRLTQKLVSKLENGQPANRDEESVTVAVLKGLANIGRVGDSVVDKLVSIANNKKSPTRVRVAVLDVFQSDACKNKLRDAALNLLKNRQEDSEIRIKAYLVVAECPNGKVANALKDLLENEPVYQVGGFIVSHLRNLRSSANPSKEYAKQQLGQIRTSKKFPIDPRKYSFNNEFSYSFDTFGLSSSVESNVIYSQNSFLPRSVNLNLTGELFGHTFNFLEIGGRQENLDKVLEHYFGPLGVFSKHEDDFVDAASDSAKKFVDYLKNKVQKITRSRRDVSKQEIDSFGKQIQVPKDIVNSDLDLDLSVKIFGSELLFLSLNQDIDNLSPKAILDKFFDKAEEGIDKAKSFDFVLRDHLIFLEFDLAYPTSLGFPLKLSVEGSSAVHLAAKGSVDIRKILQDPKNANVKVSVIPSANVEVTGSLSVDTHVVQAGIKVVNSLLTSTGSDITVQLLDDGRGFDVKLSLPLEKQTVLSANHEFVFVSQELGKQEVAKPLKFTTKQKEFAMCFDQLSPFIGLEFCVDVNIPDAAPTSLPFPLSGPAKLSVVINKEDVPYYHFKALYNDKNKEHRKAEFLYETPGSQVDRKVNLLFEAATKPDYLLRATLQSPFKSATLEGVAVDNNQEKSLAVKAAYDQIEYSGKVGFQIKGGGPRSVYQPLLQYKTPSSGGQPGYSIQGQIVKEESGQGSKYTFQNIQLIAPNQPTIGIQGFLSRQGGAYVSDLKLTRENQYAILKGKVEVGSKDLAVEAQLQNSVNPDTNFDLQYKYSGDTDQKLYSNSLSFIHGRDLTSRVNVLKLNQKYKFGNDNKKVDVDVTNEVSYPAVGLEGKFNVKVNEKEVDYELAFAYDKFKLKSELDTQFGAKHPKDYDIDFELQVIDNKIEIEAKRSVQGEKSKIENKLDLSGRQYRLDGTVHHHIKSNDVNIATDLALKVYGKPEVIKIVTKFEANQQQLDSSAKLTVGNVVYVDVLVKGVKGANANGNLKVLLKDLLNANGQFRANNGRGTGSIIIELPKYGRKIKGESSFTVVEPTYDATITLYLDFDKDKTKNIYLQTNNKITESSIDSKNKLQLFDNNLEANFKGSYSGDKKNGKINGEGDLTLPDGQYLYAKYDSSIQTSNNVASGNELVKLEAKQNKNQRGSSLLFSGDFKDVDVEKVVGSYIIKLNIEHGGKTANINSNLKRLPGAQGYRIDSDFRADGNLVPNTVFVSVVSDGSDRSGDYQFVGQYGPTLKLTVGGKYDLVGGEKPYSGNINVDLATGNEKYRSLKLDASGSLRKPQSQDGAYEIVGSGSVGVNDKVAKGSANVKAGKHSGNFAVSLNLPDEEPFDVSGKYDHEEGENNLKVSNELSLSFGKDKYLKGNLKLDKPNENDLSLNLNLQTSNEKARNVQLQLTNKQSNGGKKDNTDVTLSVDNKKYVLTSELVLLETSPAIDIQFTNANNVKSQVRAKYTKLGPKKYSGELKLVKIGDLDADIDGQADVESIDNFHIVVNANSGNLKLDHIKAEAQSKSAAKGGKRIQFSVKSANKNLVSGSTNYLVKEEGGKYIVEGHGSVKVKDESKQAHFKFIRENLELAKDTEDGFHVVLNGGVGNSKIVGELKLTNKHFRLLNSYCEQNEQCAHFEIQSKLLNAEVEHFNHELEINIDLRKLGLTHEFGLKAVTSRQNHLVDHTTDIHFEKQQGGKYQYSLYLHPDEAGVVLTTPKRVIAVEGKKSKRESGPGSGTIKAEVAVYLNKKAEPSKKTLLSYSTDYSLSGSNKHTNTELRLSNPAVGKDLYIKHSGSVQDKGYEFNTEIDVFAKKSQKVTVSGKFYQSSVPNKQGVNITDELHIESKGLNLNVDALAHLSVTTDEFSYGSSVSYQLENVKKESTILARASTQDAELLIKVLNRNLAHIRSKLQLSDKLQVADIDVVVIGVKPTVSRAEIKNYNTLKYVAYRTDSPQNKFQISSGITPGQTADFRVDVVYGGKSNSLAHFNVKLDDANFLKSEYGASADNIKQYLLEPIKKDVSSSLEELNKLSDAYQKENADEIQHLNQVLTKSAPSVKPVVQYYQQELLKIRDELLADKTIKEIAEFVQNVFGAISESVGQVLSKLNDIIEKASATVQQSLAGVLEVIKKDILPQLQKLRESTFSALKSIIDSGFNIFFQYFAKLSEILKAHQTELKELVSVVSDSLKDVLKVLVKTYEQVQKEVQEFVKNIIEQIKQLPIVENLKEQYNEYVKDIYVPEQLVGTITEVAATLADAAPTQEIKDFVNSVSVYLQKKVKREQVDDFAQLKSIYNSLIKAVESLVKLVKSQQGPAAEEFKGLFGNVVPLSFDTAIYIPRLVALKLSPLKFLTSDDLPTYKDLLRSYKTSGCIGNYIPPYEFHAIVVQGQHLFTFDQRHLTFPGKCSYLWAKDSLNGNFSIVGTYNNGLLESITFADKKDVITIKKGGAVTLNKGNTELPVRKDELSAYRLVDSINIRSKAGVHIVCGLDFIACGIHVSGYYHGRLRGLLGNSNNEPYDDYVLPSGKVSTSESEFGNAYKIGQACGNVKTVDHSVHHSVPSCDALFARDSNLRPCTYFVDPANYKQACEHGVASGIPNTEYAIAVGYVAECISRGIPVKVPRQYVKCTNSEKPFEVDTQFSVKVPNKAADIVVIVDQSKPNEVVYKELVQPLISQLTNELNSKGINDVELGLVGFGGDYTAYPSLYTQGGKILFRGKLQNLKFSEEKKHSDEDILKIVQNHSLQEFLRTVLSVGRDSAEILGFTTQSDAAKAATSYPFRSHASKTILLVLNSCESSKLPYLQAIRALLVTPDLDITPNVIVNIEGLNVKDQKQTQSVVGFNEKSVFTLADSKKKIPGNTELYDYLQYDKLPCDLVTLKLGGNVYAANNFVQAKGNQRKQFAQVVSHSLVNQIVSQEKGLDCKCRYVNPYTAQNFCKVVHVKEKEQQRTKSGVKG